MKKRVLAMFLAVMLLLSSAFVAACNKTDDNTGGNNADVKYKVTFDTAGNGGYTVPAQEIDKGAKVTQPVPDAAGYTLAWFKDSARTQAWDFNKDTVSADITLYLKRTAISYNITYNVPAGAAHSNPETYTVESAAITLQDASLAGYTFGGWFLEAGYTTAAESVPAGSTGDKAFFAKLDKITYTITENNGVTAAGVRQIGETITLSVTPGTGKEVDYFTKDGDPISGSTFTMPAANVTVGVVLKNTVYSITALNGVTASGVREYNQTITLSVTPAAGYEVDYFKKDDGSMGVGVTTFTMPAANVTVDVVFKKITYTITENNGVTASGTRQIGETITLSVTPGTGMEIDYYTKDGSSMGAGVTTFTMPAANVTVGVVLKAITYTITKPSDVSVSGTAQYNQTITLTYTGTPVGERLDYFTVDGSPIAGNTFTMPAKSVTVAVVLKAAGRLDLWAADPVEVNFLLPETFMDIHASDKLAQVLGGYYGLENYSPVHTVRDAGKGDAQAVFYGFDFGGKVSRVQISPIACGQYKVYASLDGTVWTEIDDQSGGKSIATASDIMLHNAYSAFSSNTGVIYIKFVGVGSGFGIKYVGMSLKYNIESEPAVYPAMNRPGYKANFGITVTGTGGTEQSYCYDAKGNAYLDSNSVGDFYGLDRLVPARVLRERGGGDSFIYGINVGGKMSDGYLTFFIGGDFKLNFSLDGTNWTAGPFDNGGMRMVGCDLNSMFGAGFNSNVGVIYIKVDGPGMGSKVSCLTLNYTLDGSPATYPAVVPANLSIF